MRAIICLLLGIFALANCAHATVGVWNLVGNPSRVTVNFLSNHDYYPRNWPYAFRAQSAALEAVRRDLVLHGKLEDEPILVRLPGAGFTGTPKGTRLFLKTVALQRGDSEEILSRRRYVIEWNEENRPAPDTPEFFDGLLLLTLHLQKLNAQNTELEIENLSNLRSESASQIAQYQKLMQHFDPIWSPDGRHLVFAAWQNGRLDFWLLDVAQRKVWKLEALQSVPAGRPLWSRVGEYLAYADLHGVKVLQIANAQTRTFELPHTKANPSYEMLLLFHESPNHQERLLIAFDTNLFNSYPILDLELPTLNEMAGTSNRERPKWAKDSAEQARLFETRRAVSPNGEWAAQIEEARGVRRLVLSSSDGRKSFRVVDLPAQNVADVPNISLAPPAIEPKQNADNAQSDDSAPRETDARWKILVAGAAVLLGLLFFARKFFERPSA